MMRVMAVWLLVLMTVQVSLAQITDDELPLEAIDVLLQIEERGLRFGTIEDLALCHIDPVYADNGRGMSQRDFAVGLRSLWGDVVCMPLVELDEYSNQWLLFTYEGNTIIPNRLWYRVTLTEYAREYAGIENTP